MRNFIVHGYNIVDKQEVFHVIENDLMPLKDNILAYLKEINDEM